MKMCVHLKRFLSATRVFKRTPVVQYMSLVSLDVWFLSCPIL